MRPAKQIAAIALVSSIIAVIGVAPARAQSCPADLSALAGQISEPDLQAELSVPILTVISQAGGLAQAVANAQTNLSLLQNAQASLGNDDDAATRQYAADALTVANARLAALQCQAGQ